MVLRAATQLIFISIPTPHGSSKYLNPKRHCSPETGESVDQVRGKRVGGNWCVWVGPILLRGTGNGAGTTHTTQEENHEPLGPAYESSPALTPPMGRSLVPSPRAPPPPSSCLPSQPGDCRPPLTSRVFRMQPGRGGELKDSSGCLQGCRGQLQHVAKRGGEPTGAPAATPFPPRRALRPPPPGTGSRLPIALQFATGASGRG